MTTTTLWLSLAVGAAGALLVWLAVRGLTSRLTAHRHAAGKCDTHSAEAAAPQDCESLRPENIQAVYRRVLLRRVGGLLLCLGAFAAWVSGVDSLLCIVPAAAGCVLQYLAYRMRTCYAILIARQKRAEEDAALAKSIVRPSTDNTAEKATSLSC